MGLKQPVTWVFGLFFVYASFTPCFAENNVVLEQVQWPDKVNCDICVTVQFGKLEMLLPLSEVGKLLVINSDSSALHVLPKTGNSREGALFLSVKPERLMKTYRDSGLLRGLGIKTNEQLFDAMGKLPAGNKSISTIRRIEHIDQADRYLKTSKESLHVYWIKSFPPNSQGVYFVIDGQETVYLLAGNVTQRLYEAVLSNIRVVNVP